MKEAIYKRKSIRKFHMEKLDETTLNNVKAQFAKLKPLHQKMGFSIQIVSKIKGTGSIKAPHYLVFGSEETGGYLENIGFVGQQMDLWFSASGLGSCWLGLSKPGEKEVSALPYVICMAFGKPDEPLYRGHGDFKRKPLNEISEGTDPRLEAARLAPSGLNSQNWHFIADEGKIHCYRKKSNPIKGLFLDKINKIDLGIAINHIAQESDNFAFAKDDNAPERKGLIYTGTVI
ncbi:MAG: nitroreductase [Defluviitaleaceae bacterium]|nr:nitroreductase [Defluviitaleaceae bacterium]